MDAVADNSGRQCKLLSGDFKVKAGGLPLCINYTTACSLSTRIKETEILRMIAAFNLLAPGGYHFADEGIETPRRFPEQLALQFKVFGAGNHAVLLEKIVHRT